MPVRVHIAQNTAAGAHLGVRSGVRAKSRRTACACLEDGDLRLGGRTPPLCAGIFSASRLAEVGFAGVGSGGVGAETGGVGGASGGVGVEAGGARACGRRQDSADVTCLLGVWHTRGVAARVAGSGQPRRAGTRECGCGQRESGAVPRPGRAVSGGCGCVRVIVTGPVAAAFWVSRRFRLRLHHHLSSLAIAIAIAIAASSLLLPPSPPPPGTPQHPFLAFVADAACPVPIAATTDSRTAGRSPIPRVRSGRSRPVPSR